jgi:hypothetical protein
VKGNRFSIMYNFVKVNQEMFDAKVFLYAAKKNNTFRKKFWSVIPCNRPN